MTPRVRTVEERVDDAFGLIPKTRRLQNPVLAADVERVLREAFEDAAEWWADRTAHWQPKEAVAAFRLAFLGPPPVPSAADLVEAAMLNREREPGDASMRELAECAVTALRAAGKLREGER